MNETARIAVQIVWCELHRDVRRALTFTRPRSKRILRYYGREQEMDNKHETKRALGDH
jgi:hypothetical protein